MDYIKKGGVYMASHELHVCTTFSRRFFWSDMNLWPEDLAPGSVVLLSGRDDLMDAQQVKAMLEEPGHIKVGGAGVHTRCLEHTASGGCLAKASNLAQACPTHPPPCPHTPHAGALQPRPDARRVSLQV